MIDHFNLNRKRFVSILLFIVGLSTITLLVMRVIQPDCANNLDYYVVTSDEFVSQVWPPPEAKIPLICNFNNTANIVTHEGQGVGATLVTAKIDEFWHSPPNIPLENRVELFLDNHKINENPISIYLKDLYYCDENRNCTETGRPAAINVFWDPFLSIGKHTVIIRVTNDTEKIFEFSWTFTITW